MRGTKRTAPAGSRRTRRILARALVVVGGSIAGTAAAWAISSGGAVASELPDTRPAAGHQAIDHSLESGAGELLSTRDKLTERLDEPAAALPAPEDVSTAVRPATGAVHEVDTAVRTGAAQAHDADAVGAGLRDTVRGTGDDLSTGLDTAGKKVRNDLGDPLGPIADPIAEPITKPLKPVTEPLNPVTDPLAPVTEPVPGIGNPPPADLPTPADPSSARGHAAVPQHDTDVDHHAGIVPRPGAQAPASDADRGTRHLPAGGLPLDPFGSDYERPILPLDLPAGSGSTGHDSASVSSHGPVAGEHSDVPLLPDPALVRALIPDEDRLNIKLAEQPGTTPD